MTSLELRTAAITDVGCKRKNNEDSILSLPKRGLFCVADGMGGAREGQVASKALTDALSQAFSGTDSLDLPAKVDLVRETVKQVNLWIKNRVEERGFSQMGSTVVVGLFDNKNASKGIVVHAGDSRMYRYRDRTIKQLTADHTFVAELGAKNEKSLPAEFRGVVTKAVGLRDDLVLDETPFDIEPSDLFFICSDGLTRMLPDKSLQKLLRQNEAMNPEALTRLLVEEAKKAGGDDNISVIVIRTGQGSAADNGARGSSTRTQGDVDEPETACTATVNPPWVRPLVEGETAKSPVNVVEEEPSEIDAVEGDTPNTADTDQSAQKKAEGFPRRQGVGLKVFGGVVALAVLVVGFVVIQRQKGDTGGGATIGAMVTSSGGAGSVPTIIAPGNGSNGIHVETPQNVTGTSPAPSNVEAVSMASTNEVVATAQPTVPTLIGTTTAVAVSGRVADTNISPVEPVLATTTGPVMVASSAPKVVEPVVLPSTSGITGTLATAVAITTENVSTVAPAVGKPPVALVTKSKEDEEKESLENARSTLAGMVDGVGRSGKWGALRKEIGPWWDKLDQVEPDAAKRRTLQGWVSLWDDALKDANSQQRVQNELAGMRKIAETMDVKLPPAAMTEGPVEERANGLCRSYYEQQFLLLKGLESFAAKQGQMVSSLGETLAPCLNNLWVFLDGASAASDCGGISERLAKVRDRANGVKDWARTNLVADIPMGPEQYPATDIKKIMDEADEAWDRLYILIEPLSAPIAFKRNSVDDVTNAKLDKIEILHKALVVERGNFSTVRQWRGASNPVRIRDLLTEISIIVTAQEQRAGSSN